MAGACSLAFDLDRNQCESNADCEAIVAGSTCVEHVCTEPQSQGGSGGGGGPNEGGGGAPPIPENFSCLGSFVEPDPGDPVHHSYRLELATGQPGTPPLNMSVDLCNKLDVDCTNPQTITPDADSGSFEFDVAKSFQGFLLVHADAPSSPDPIPIVPTIVFFLSPVVVPEKEIVVRVIDPVSFEALSNAAGVPIDPDRGTSIVLTYDCNGDRAKGVHLESDDVDADTTPFHFKAALPDPNSVQTDDQGAGGFVNMPPGDFTVRSYVYDGHYFIGETSFLSRAGFLSYVPIGPTEQ